MKYYIIGLFDVVLARRSEAISILEKMGSLNLNTGYAFGRLITVANQFDRASWSFYRLSYLYICRVGVIRKIIGKSGLIGTWITFGKLVKICKNESLFIGNIPLKNEECMEMILL